MRKRLERLFALMLTMCLTALALPASAQDADAAVQTESPAEDEMPQCIALAVSIAREEWADLAGARLDKSNKYTWWRCGKGCSFGWCGGFVTWCMLEAGVPMDELEDVPDAVEDPYHVKEASVGKLLRGYEKLGRTTNVPRPGYCVVYGVDGSVNKTVHVGLVCGVQELGGGRYRLTTIEGNVSNRVKMYLYDYDLSEEKATENMSVIPEEERDTEANVYTSYRLQSDKWYVNTFLMSWVPEK